MGKETRTGGALGVPGAAVDRRTAAAMAEQLGFPGARDEAWRYTAIAAHAARDWGETLDGSVESLIVPAQVDNLFVQMNRARSQPGYRLIGKGGTVNFHYSAAHQHNVIALDAGEHAVVIEDLASAGGSTGTALTEIKLADGANLVRVQLRRHAEGAVHVGHTAVEVGGDARFTNIDMNIGGGLVRNEITVKLLAPQARCELLGTYLLAGREHCDTLSYVEHKAPDTFSDEIYKGVVRDQGRGVFQGKIRVDQDAQRIVGNQLSRGLLLGQRSRIDVKPELEIFADDVICSHGSTIGDLDPEQLFYLRSRGIGRIEAEAMLVQAFVAEIIALMPEPHVDRDALLAEVAGWLAGAA